VAILAVEVAMTGAIETLDQLRRRVRGRVVEPAEPDFDQLRRTFNAMLDRRPRVIVRPVDTTDVAAAVGWAAEVGLPISVRGGGHSVAGHAVGPDALMIDLGELRRVTVDRRGRTAEVGGGALLEDLDRATTAVGLAAPSGTYLDTGVGGLTLAGGIGFLLGCAGFACDALVGAEVVTADGSVVEVDAASDPELLWALRGGGGNFGVVTKLRHALLPLTHVYGGQVKFAGPAVPEVVRLLFELQGPDAPEELTIQGTVGLDAERGPVASVYAAWVGALEEGPRRLAPITELPGAFIDGIGPTTYLALQTMGDRMGPTYRHYWKGQFVADVSAGLQATVLDHAASAPADSAILIEPIHGVAHRYPDGHAAFGGRRAVANVSALGIWSDVSDDVEAIGWARKTTSALEPFSLRGGGYLNYAPDDETANRVEQAFGRESFRRLQAVKRRVDPHNRFRFNANIPPG
jgi:FAD/FMN-containing dehydrogenase